MAKTAKKLILPPALGSYAFIFKARDPIDPAGKAKFSIALLWPKAEKDKLKPLADAIAEVAVAKFGADAVAKLKNGLLWNPLRDGDAPDRAEDPVFKGMLYANVSSERQPGIVDKNVQPVFEDSEAYSGCTYRASVAIFAFDKKGKKGISLGLNNLQVVKKGPRLDGRKPPEDDFKDFREEGGPAAPEGGKTGADDLLG